MDLTGVGCVNKEGEQMEMLEEEELELQIGTLGLGIRAGGSVSVRSSPAGILRKLSPRTGKTLRDSKV